MVGNRIIYPAAYRLPCFLYPYPLRIFYIFWLKPRTKELTWAASSVGTLTPQLKECQARCRNSHDLGGFLIEVAQWPSSEIS